MASVAEPLTLPYLYKLAIEWCPVDARWPHLFEDELSWGPAHELGHALIEPRWRWEFFGYTRCNLYRCHCGRDLCTVYEAAAMTISGRILDSMGEGGLADNEIDNTVDYDTIERSHFERAKTLLRRKRLWPVPRTRASLESALRRRLGKPRGSPLKARRSSP